jgi:putative ABC transport system permease protein
MLSDVVSRLRSLLRRTTVEAELDDELRFHFELQVEKYVKSGLPREEARRRARLEFGGLDQVKEECREARGVHLIETLAQDIRYGLRTLRKSPGFTAVAVLTLAVGIGASTAIFSAVNPILFEPLPYSHPNRITMIWDSYQGERQDVTFHTYREIAERSHSFDALAVMETWQPTMTSSGEPERLVGQRVTFDYFRVLDVQPVAGRDFQVADDQIHGAKVAILSDGLWQRRFGGDRGIAGRQITLDGDAYTVIGVMPRGFENVLSPSAELWTPLHFDTGSITNFESAEWGHHLRAVGRLRPGIVVDQGRGELNAIAQTPVPEFPRAPWAALQHGLIVDSLQDDVTRGVKPALLAILGAVVLVLLIACVNVTNLLLARGAQRRGEFAVRAALGAGKSRLAQQLLTESVLVAALGGACGVIVAKIGVNALIALSPPELPRVNAIAVNGTVFAFALGITVLIGLAVGLIPAMHAFRTDLHTGMQESTRRAAGGHQLTRRMLVVAEVALALVLLVSAGLLLRSIERLFAVAPGFDGSHLLAMQVQTSGHKFDDENVLHRFFAQALDDVRGVPGVTSAAFTSLLPLGGDKSGSYGAAFEDDKPGAGYNVFRYAVTPGYFETMRIPLRSGRYLEKQDVAGAPRAVVISESLARRKFGGRNPIDTRVHIGPTGGPWYFIVGVVGDVKQTSLAIEEPDAVYISTTQSWFADDALSLVIRSPGETAKLVPDIRKAIWSVDKDQPITHVTTMDELLAESGAERHFAMILFEAFGIVALILAGIGIYGVLSGSVTERTREIGIRSALGASRGNILGLVLREGMMLTALGAAIGLVGALVASGAIVTLLFGISRLDPPTYVGVIAILVGVSAIACWVPAWRAGRVDPAITLRGE